MKVGIIGSGLSGLTCAWYLKKNNIKDITIFEASEKIGGRLQTDLIDGFTLDRGFQVLLPAYPEAKCILNYNKLQLQRFDKGSLIYKNGKQIPFFDPENGFSALFQTILHGPGSLWDKVILLKLKWSLSQQTVEDIFQNKETISSLTYLNKLGFSKKMIHDFWIPFYQGVFLENNLETDSKMLQFTFKMFAEDGAAVPKNGMNAIPMQLVDYIGEEKIKKNTKVVAFDQTWISTENDQKIVFDKVVLACDFQKESDYHSVTNHYYQADTLPFSSRHVILNANQQKVVNNVVLMSTTAPSYATNGKHLISVSGNGKHTNTAVFLKDLESIFGKEVANWKLIKSYIIKEALPIIGFENKYVSCAKEGVFYCGDHLIQGSINGAMESGRKTAEEILKSM